MNLLIGYAKCSTCKKAQNWLQEQNITFEYRDIKTENPTQQELTDWWQTSQLPRQKFVNTSGQLYRQMNLKEKLPSMSDTEFFAFLATDGMLVKRPILITPKGVCTGFKPEEWKQII